MLLLTAVVTYGTENRNIIDVTASFAIPFKTSHLGASFWCAASSCIISFMICILFLVATIKVGSRSIRHGIPLPTRRRYRRHQRRQSLEMTQAIRNNSPTGADETVSLYRMPVFNTSSIFDIPRQATAGATCYGTSEKIDRIGNDIDCCKDVLYSKIRMKENEKIKAPRNHDSSSAKYMSDLQNNLNHPLDKPSSSIRYADHSHLHVNEMHENDNNDARSAQIREHKPPGIPKNEFNHSSDLNECDLSPRDFMNSLERDRTPIAVSSRNVVAQMSSQYVPRYAWTAAAHENKGRSFNFDFQTGS